MPGDGTGEFDAERVLRLLAARAADAVQGRDGGLQQLLALFERILNGGFVALRNNPAPRRSRSPASSTARRGGVGAYQPAIKFCAVGE